MTVQFISLLYFRLEMFTSQKYRNKFPSNYSFALGASLQNAGQFKGSADFLLVRLVYSWILTGTIVTKCYLVW